MEPVGFLKRIGAGMKGFIWKSTLIGCCIFFELAAVSLGFGTEIDIVYVSKMPEIESSKKGVGGLAELGQMVRGKRLENDNTLFLHGGDSLAPSAMSSFDHGTHMIDLLNSMEPEVMAVNEREFAYKEDELVLRISEAAFPFVSSNLLDPSTGNNLEGVEGNQCFEYDGYNICVMSVIDPMVVVNYLPDRIQVKDSFTAVKEMASNLKAAGADILILLSGYDFDEMGALLKHGVVDIVFHSSSSEDKITPVAGGLLASQGTSKGKVLSVRMELERGEGGEILKKFTGEVVALNVFTSDPEIQNKVDYYIGKLAEIMDVVIGSTLVALDTKYISVRTRENAFANLMADSLREYYGADIAFVNGGSIRGDRLYKPGEILTRKDIQSEQPFRNESRLLVVTGEQVWQAVENGLSLVEEKKGRFLHVSGMNVKYCLEEKPGNRVKNITVGTSKLDLSKSYTLAANDYIANGGDGFTMLKAAKVAKSKKGGMLVWAILRSYIEKQQEIAPQIEGRLESVCK